MILGRKRYLVFPRRSMTCPWDTFTGKHVSVVIDSIPSFEIRSLVLGVKNTRYPTASKKLAQNRASG